jgi:hypothetical protein
MYVLYHNWFLKFQILEFSLLLINLLPPLLSEDIPYYPATGQEEDDFNLFPLPSSSYYDQNVCSLPQLVPEVPDIRVLPVVDQSPSTTAADLLGVCPTPDVLQPSIEAPVIQGDEVPRRMSHITHQTPPKLQEYVTYIVKHPVSKVLSYDKLSSDH